MLFLFEHMRKKQASWKLVLTIYKVIKLMLRYFSMQTVISSLLPLFCPCLQKKTLSKYL